MGERPRENRDAIPPSAVRITVSRFRDSERHALGEESLVLKAPRRSGARKLVEEWLNELVCHRLALRIGIPAAETSVKRMADGELFLGSVRHSDIGLNSIPQASRDQIVNIHILPGLLVFDQLVFNSDRREDHIMLTGDPGMSEDARWYAIDHGHTFHGPNGAGVTLEMIEGIAEELAPIKIDYRIERFSDLDRWLERVTQLTDYEVEALVDETAASLIAMGVSVDVRARVEFRKEVIKAFLKRRRDALPSILREWWTTKGKPSSLTVATAESPT